jgi:nucleobase:cation symporter-1, NCS1 family
MPQLTTRATCRARQRVRLSLAGPPSAVPSPPRFWSILPIWFLIPFAIVAILGLVGGAVLDIYSSGLALLSAGIRIPRPAAAAIDGVVMIVGAIYVVFVSTDFIHPFEAFLITLGVPVSAWCGVFIADIVLRRKNYSEPDLYKPKGRYGSVRWVAIVLIVIGTALGWGLITNTTAGVPWLDWQGYLLAPFGLGGRTGAWEYANLGVLVSLLIGFVGTLIFGRAAVRRQESLK